MVGHYKALMMMRTRSIYRSLTRNEVPTKVTETDTKHNYIKSYEAIMTLMTLMSPIIRKKTVDRKERIELHIVVTCLSF